jgi:hypothetical protein
MAVTGFGLLLTLAVLPLLPPGMHRFYVVSLSLRELPIAAMHLTLDRCR